MAGNNGARIAHLLPGRVRVKLAREHRSPELVQAIKNELLALQGINEIHFNPTTGSLLVLYDPVQVDIAQLLDYARVSGLIGSESPIAQFAEEWQGGKTPLARNIISTARALDVGLAQSTRGRLDLKMLVPLGLIALVIREVAAGRTTSAPWYVLAWYAFETFRHFHSPEKPQMSSGQ